MPASPPTAGGRTADETGVYAQESCKALRTSGIYSVALPCLFQANGMNSVLRWDAPVQNLQFSKMDAQKACKISSFWYNCGRWALSGSASGFHL
jgi:hypothetical protein